MSLVLRLRKIGKSAKKRYNFRIVACDSKGARDGKFIEELGHYDPSQNPSAINIRKDRIDYWIKQGAKPSDSVRSIIKKGAKS